MRPAATLSPDTEAPAQCSVGSDTCDPCSDENTCKVFNDWVTRHCTKYPRANLTVT